MDYLHTPRFELPTCQSHLPDPGHDGYSDARAVFNAAMDRHPAGREAKNGAAAMTATTIRALPVRYRIHIDLLPVATVVADRHGRAVAVNQAWTEMTCLSDRDSIDKGWLEPLTGEDRLRILHTLNALEPSGNSTLGDYRLRIGRAQRWTRWAARTTAGGPLLAVTVTDIDAERARCERLSRAANTDSLTGLVNRGELLRLTTEALARDQATVGMFYVDLDQFKTVNDTGGHLLGDRVLVAAAARLHAAVRPSAVTGRVGGDEFAVLCPDLPDPNQAGLLAARLEAALADPIEADGIIFQIGATAGAAIALNGQTAEELLGAADRAMYEARNARHTRCVPKDAVHVENDATAIEVADILIRRIFAIGVTLAATAGTVDPPAAERLKIAIRQLDEITSDLRHAAGDRHPDRRATSTDVTARSAEPAFDEIAGQLELIGRHLDDLATPTEAADHETVPLLDAAHSFHRTRIELALLAEPSNPARQKQTLSAANPE
jgi:diguanylate cyclase (GGDEF)-like protein